MMWWGHGWWWIVLLVVCVVVMARMMGHGGHGGQRHGGADTAERMLANRLASGEIDIEEYERLREVLGRTDGTTGGGVPRSGHPGAARITHRSGLEGSETEGRR